MWSLLDIAAVRQEAKDALHYEISARYQQSEVTATGEVASGLGDLALILDDQINQSVSKGIADDVKNLATKLLGSALATTTIEPAGEGDQAGGETPTEADETAVVAEVKPKKKPAARKSAPKTPATDVEVGA